MEPKIKKNKEEKLKTRNR